MAEDEVVRGQCAPGGGDERVGVAGMAGGLQDAGHAEDVQDDPAFVLVALDHLEAGYGLGGGGPGGKPPEVVDELLCQVDVGLRWPGAGCPGELLQVEGDVGDIVAADAAPLEALDAESVEVLRHGRTSDLAADAAVDVADVGVGVLGQVAPDGIGAEGVPVFSSMQITTVPGGGRR